MGTVGFGQLSMQDAVFTLTGSPGPRIVVSDQAVRIAPPHVSVTSLAWTGPDWESPAIAATMADGSIAVWEWWNCVIPPKIDVLPNAHIFDQIPMEAWVVAWPPMNNSKFLYTGGDDSALRRHELENVAGAQKPQRPLIEPQIPPPQSDDWSVQEQQNFQNLLCYFGANWQAIADTMKTKSDTMVRNYYNQALQEEEGEFLEKICLEADERIKQGEDWGPPHKSIRFIPSKYDPVKYRFKADLKTHGSGVTAIVPLWRITFRNTQILLTGSYDEYIRLLYLKGGIKTAEVMAKRRLDGGVWQLKLLQELPNPQDPAGCSFSVLASCMQVGCKIVKVHRNSEGEWGIDIVAEFMDPERTNPLYYTSDFHIGLNCSKLQDMTFVSATFYDEKLYVWKVEEEGVVDSEKAEDEESSQGDDNIFTNHGDAEMDSWLAADMEKDATKLFGWGMS
ncbi:MAG: hypothetical protein Q9221_004005 [Calogaya cf. arnoldii]